MTIAYNLGIPNAPNNPSTDQPNMKTNNDNIATYVGIDHVAFNTAGSGQHNQVTFNANNVPSVPTAPPVFFTNTVDGLPQPFFYSGDAAHSSTQYVNSANGSTFLLGGMIVKWGLVNLVDNTTFVFPVAFPNHCYNVQITVGAKTSPSPTLVTVAAISSPTGFTPRVTFANGTTAPSISCYYLAIGN